MASKHTETFWPSYVDIMTSLFAVMLILFAVTFSHFKRIEAELRLKAQAYDDILNINTTTREIDASPYFDYDHTYLKHTFTVSVQYAQKEYSLAHIADRERSLRAIREAGELVQRTVQKMEERQGDGSNIKFLVVIEGQSSRIPFGAGEDAWHNNSTLSYLRAQGLRDYWRDSCDVFRAPGRRCEVIVAGSGEGGVPRVETDPEAPDFLVQEQKNQRFLINIVPVIGVFETEGDKFN